MARHVQTRAEHIGYRDQLDRARRFLDRIEQLAANDVEFQDMVWAFFQNGWHIKDWVRNDPLGLSVRSGSRVCSSQSVSGDVQRHKAPRREAWCKPRSHRYDRSSRGCLRYGLPHRQRGRDVGFGENACASMRERMGGHSSIARVVDSATELKCYGRTPSTPVAHSGIIQGGGLVLIPARRTWEHR